MDTAAFSQFVAILGLLCFAGTFATVVVAVAARVRPESAAAVLLDGIGGAALWLGWLVATVTTLGSLYFSEVAHYLPCELCWYQRICIYPLSVVLLVAALRRDRDVWWYVVPVAAIGSIVSIYHSQLQAYPEQKTFCDASNPCTARYVWEFGFVSLPLMALAAFLFVITMTLVARATDPGRFAGDPADAETLEGDPS